VHYSAVNIPGFASLKPGQYVVLKLEHARQDDFGLRSLAVNRGIAGHGQRHERRATMRSEHNG
jgi:hypothetical protein